MIKNENSNEILKVAYKALDDKLGIDIKILDISEVSSMADYFIIASGSNPNQVKALADSVDDELHKIGVNLLHSEGYRTNSWILLDFGNIIVHIFNKEDRQYYNIERLWGDSKKVFPENFE